MAVAALIGTAFNAEPDHMDTAPVFIPHTRPERGPLWFAEPRTAFLGDIADTAAPSAARAVVEGVLFADRMIIESCIGEAQRTLYVSGAFGIDPEVPQLLADILDRDILVVDESHLPAVGAAAMCAEVLTAHVIAPPAARRVQPRPQWRDAVDRRWQQYRREWSVVTATAPLTTLDEAAVTAPPLAIPTPAAPLPRTLTRSSRP
jgi:xylulokinase